MAKILSNGRAWGGNRNVSAETREEVIRFLKRPDLSIKLIARRFAVSAAAVSTINAAENYIRPKGHRPERM